ncbi:hypothetical protein FRC03_011507 [Tulasnella sp. 419]|nr:hypothetical protein FRC03_011507 [Tulasnella sp. 419]
MECLKSGTEVSINEALENGGPGAKVALCQGAIFRLNNSIVFRHEEQELFTEGFPEGDRRAMLLVEGEDLAMAIKGDCNECNGIQLQNLIIDGNRPNLLRIKKGSALVEMGNANNQIVRGCRIYEPRGWSALHFREGDWKSCSGALVEYNDVGPSGEEWDDNYDGVVIQANPPWGWPNADGISLACKNSVVRHNVVHDTTDAAIVIFGSAGSHVYGNRVYSRTREMLGGINLVDYEPWDGDYTDVVVENNTIEAIGAFIHVGLPIGLSVWTADVDKFVANGTVRDNTLSGDKFGYGLVVASATNFTVLNNVATGTYSGSFTYQCPTSPRNASPRPYLINKWSSEGVFQSELIHGEVQNIICISPSEIPGQPKEPRRRFRDSPEAIAARTSSTKASPAEVAELETRFSEVLVTSQLRLMREIASLSRSLSKEGEDELNDDSGPSYNATATLEDFMARLETMEKDRILAKQAILGLRSDLAIVCRSENCIGISLMSFLQLVQDVKRVQSPSTVTQGIQPTLWIAMVAIAGIIMLLYRIRGRRTRHRKE